jgi:hypothetical protein
MKFVKLKKRRILTQSREERQEKSSAIFTQRHEEHEGGTFTPFFVS